MIYPLEDFKYNISFQGFTTTWSCVESEEAVLAAVDDFTTDWAVLRPSTPCQICNRALEKGTLSWLLALLSVTMRTLLISRTTFMPVSLA